MAVNTIYWSPTKTSKKVALQVGETLAKKLGTEQKNKSITYLKEREGLDWKFTKEDIVILALPVYGGRIPALLEDTIKAIKGENTPVVLMAVYGNRDIDDALLEMKDLVQANGFVPVAAASFIGEHSFSNTVGTDRPDKEDLTIAAKFGEKVAELLASKKELTPVEVPGKFPYQERGPAAPVAPITTDACYDCMLCANECPTGAISLDNPRNVDPNKCVKCCNCVKVCPVNAKTFNGALDQSIGWLEANCSERREPQFFL